MKCPEFVPRGQKATSSSIEGPSQPSSSAFKDGYDRIFKKRKSTPGYTIIRYASGKRVEVNDCEVKSRSEIGLKPLKKELI